MSECFLLANCALQRAAFWCDDSKSSLQGAQRKPNHLWIALRLQQLVGLIQQLECAQHFQEVGHGHTVMPALQKAKPVKLAGEGLAFASVSLPKQRRETRIVKDMAPDDIAREIVEWIKKD